MPSIERFLCMLRRHKWFYYNHPEAKNIIVRECERCLEYQLNFKNFKTSRISWGYLTTLRIEELVLPIERLWVKRNE